MQTNFSVSKVYLDLANQIFELNRKLEKLPSNQGAKRHLDNIANFLQDGLLSQGGLFLENPLGTKYNETRTDCECVGIAGEDSGKLVISEVVKPLIRFKYQQYNQIVQRAVVVVTDEKLYRFSQLEQMEQEQKNVQVPELNKHKSLFDAKRYLRLCFQRIGLNLSNLEAEKILQKFNYKTK